MWSDIIRISRHWTGIVKPGRSNSYIQHLQAETFPKLSLIEGFITASILKREIDRGTEFLIVTEWESMEAIRAFAGEIVEEAVVPAVAQSMMVDYDKKVRHYEVIGTV
ncbi:MAG TPA: antibiotic biosynthesis monooxygenase [Blastocatellia bacterium]|nr:antibiotic biosynthesis monooxygenase [Blastocatellia bacterium]